MWPFGLRPGRNQAAQAIMLVQRLGVPAVPVPPGGHGGGPMHIREGAPTNRSSPRTDMGIPNVGILSAQVGCSRLAMGIQWRLN
jgi:hypothetical protein